MFLTSFDIYKCEEPDPSVAVHTPFLSLTVGLAAMVHEPSIVALWPSINDSILELQKKPQKTTFQSTVINCNQPALMPLASAGRSRDVQPPAHHLPLQRHRAPKQPGQCHCCFLGNKVSLWYQPWVNTTPRTLPKKCLWFQAPTSA